jgi:hypothetical protein
VELLDFENAVKLRHADWTLNKSQSGVATWIDVVAGRDLVFTIQVTPCDGIGVSRRSSGEGLDFDGHEEVFDDLGDVLKFLESQVS